ncbi:MAG: radical SAM protein [Caldisericia bacterium]
MLLGQNVNDSILIREINTVSSNSLKKSMKFPASRGSDSSQAIQRRDDETIIRMSKLKTLAPYFHLPVQAGSNEILRRMARGYTREKYLHLIDMIRKHFPVSAITPMLLLDFQVKTEEGKFQETLSHG